MKWYPQRLCLINYEFYFNVFVFENWLFTFVVSLVNRDLWISCWNNAIFQTIDQIKLSKVLRHCESAMPFLNGGGGRHFKLHWQFLSDFSTKYYIKNQLHKNTLKLLFNNLRWKMTSWIDLISTKEPKLF